MEDIQASTEEYSRESTTEAELLKAEIARIKGPVDLQDLTERCDILEKLRKAINAKLEVNITAN